MPRPELYLRSYPSPDGMQAYAAAVEEDGWDGLLLMDSQNLSMDVFGSLYLAASSTTRLKLGTAVTNLVTRHPAVVASAFATLHHISEGRAHIGVGRGDTALELIGVKPPSARQFEALIEHLQTYLRGASVDVAGFESHITWLPLEGESKVPIDVFGSGPHVIAVGARLGDRVTVTVGAEPERVEWAVQTARQTRVAAGLALRFTPTTSAPSWWSEWAPIKRRWMSSFGATRAFRPTSNATRHRRCRGPTPPSLERSPGTTTTTTTGSSTPSSQTPFPKTSSTGSASLAPLTSASNGFAAWLAWACPTWSSLGVPETLTKQCGYARTISWPKKCCPLCRLLPSHPPTRPLGLTATPGSLVTLRLIRLGRLRKPRVLAKSV
jgi:alkanesulfonate monooxygenase SsuD/methylene tetrahydromethanopterin reductase-like flavin-dependent oxidoreductase (luciferase family)